MPKSPEIRITSGKLRGRVLRSPDSVGTHPMGAREKLALFNMVNVEGARVLDAYAGSGALGIEALSRGASEVVFVESNRRVARVVQENIDNIGVLDTLESSSVPEGLDTTKSVARVFAEKVGSFAGRSEFEGYFEIILADPPYAKIQLAELNALPSLLADGGVLALSSPAEMPIIELDGMRVSSTHTYARARLAIYRRGSL